MPYRQPGMRFFERPIKLVRVRCPWCATTGVAPRATVEECHSCGARFAVDAATITDPPPPPEPAPEISPFALLVLFAFVEVLVTIGLLCG